MSIQIVPQTFAERVKMYLKNTKPQLVSMYTQRLKLRGDTDPLANTYTKVWLANWLAEDEKTHNPYACTECQEDLPNMSPKVSVYSMSSYDPVDVDDLIGPWDVQKGGGFDALELIAMERSEQIYAHGYTPETDAGYKNKELLFGALAYLNAAIYNNNIGAEDWPFKKDTFKPGDKQTNLVKAAAMIAAEIDRLTYLKKKEDDAAGKD